MAEGHPLRRPHRRPKSAVLKPSRCDVAADPAAGPAGTPLAPYHIARCHLIKIFRGGPVEKTFLVNETKTPAIPLSAIGRLSSTPPFPEAEATKQLRGPQARSPALIPWHLRPCRRAATSRKAGRGRRVLGSCDISAGSDVHVDLVAWLSHAVSSPPRRALPPRPNFRPRESGG